MLLKVRGLGFSAEHSGAVQFFLFIYSFCRTGNLWTGK